MVRGQAKFTKNPPKTSFTRRPSPLPLLSLSLSLSLSFSFPIVRPEKSANLAFAFVSAKFGAFSLAHDHSFSLSFRGKSLPLPARLSIHLTNSCVHTQTLLWTDLPDDYSLSRPRLSSRFALIFGRSAPLLHFPVFSANCHLVP